MLVGHDLAGAGEIGVERRVVLVDRVVIAAGGVALPQLDQRPRHRPPVLVEHAARDDDPLAERRARVLRVRSAASGPAQPSANTGPVISDKVCSSRIGGCFGARLTVLP